MDADKSLGFGMPDGGRLRTAPDGSADPLAPILPSSRPGGSVPTGFPSGFALASASANHTPENSQTAKSVEVYDPVYGARPLKRGIHQQLQNSLANELLAGNFPEGATINVDAAPDGFIFSAEQAVAPQPA